MSSSAQQLKPYARLAVMRNVSKYVIEGPEYRSSEKDSDVTLGGELGLRYELSRQFDVGVAAALYNTDRYDTHFFSLGLLYRFGNAGGNQ